MALKFYVRRIMLGIAGHYCNPEEGERRKTTFRDHEAAVESAELMSTASVAAASLESASVVRVVLAGGAVEVYASAIPAYLVMRRYPAGLCLARPDVFERPHDSVVCPTERLLPGQKFYLVPTSTISKLRCRIPRNHDDDSDDSKSNNNNNSSSSGSSSGLAVVEERAKATAAAEREAEEEKEGWMCPAKDFYAEKEKWTKCFLKKLVREGEGEQQKLKKTKPFRPPVRKGHRKRMLARWKPSLASVEEVSPELVG